MNLEDKFCEGGAFLPPACSLGASSGHAGVLIQGPGIPLWFTGYLSAPGGTDAWLSEPLQDKVKKDGPSSLHMAASPVLAHCGKC